MKKLLPFISLFLIASSGFSQTVISGQILSNTTWTKANSPYIIKSNVLVYDNIQLTIEPGVVVRMDSTISGITFNSGSTLHCVGTASDSIRFLSGVSQGFQAWDKLNLTDAKGITMKYVRVTGSRYGIDIYPNTFFKIENCVFFNNDAALRIKGNHDSASFLRNCEFKSNVKALYLFDDQYGCHHLKFTHNDYAVFLNATAILSDCWFYYNGQGIFTSGGAIRNSIFRWNTTAVNSSGGVLSCNTIIENETGVFFNKVVPDSTNKICHNTKYNLELGSSSPADLGKLCMCSTDSAYLALRIYDHFDDNTRGTVKFMPPRNCDSITDIGCFLPTGVPEKIPQNVRLYPNPMTDFTVLFNPSSFINARIDILNIVGACVRTYEKINGNDLKIVRDGLPSGTYFILLSNENGLCQSIKMMITE